MADATMELVERIEGMIDTSASYDAMGITRVCRAAMSEAHDAGHALGVAQERERCLKACQLIAQKYESQWASVGVSDSEHEAAAQECAAAIRAGEVRG